MEALLELDQTAIIDDLRKRAQDLLRKATGPMPVPQPNGAMARRCYVGRLTLAYRLLADPSMADKRQQIGAAIAEIAGEANTDWDAYKAALLTYERMCLNTGVPVQPIAERECRCEVCVTLDGPTVHLVASVATT